jgi:branched-subunit amino acid aminotransferase/4-amino-4-deoxychorismate lyase
VEYERLLSRHKHAGTMGIIHHGRRARQEGYDDALLTDRAGHITETAIANICFHEHGVHDDHEGRFVWPDSAHAPGLPGIMMQLLRRGMDRLGIPHTTRPVPLADLPHYHSAFVSNSTAPALPVARIDDHDLAHDADTQRRLLDAYETNPWEKL